MTGVPCDLRQPTDKLDDLRALFFRDGLMFALYMSLRIGWVDGKLASLAYDYLAFSVMYEQFFKNIHLVGAADDNKRLLCCHVSHYTRVNGHDVRARALAARAG